MQGINKQFKVTFLILVVIFGLIFLWNMIRQVLIARNIAQNMPIATVSTTLAKTSSWQPYLYAVGTLAAINGVAVSTQAAGNIVQITFQSGQCAKKGDLLVQIDDRVEQAQLLNNIAAMKLAEITYERNKQLAASGAVAKQTFDEATARYQQAVATTQQTQANIDYKHITAPFDGKLGIMNINLGQYVKPGDNLVSLQAMDPLHVNFYLPEKNLSQLYVGQKVVLTVDSPKNKEFVGKINALDSNVDLDTHNISIQATIPNPKELLYPGLFARIKIILPQKKNVVIIPQTAVNYSLYGNTVYVVKKPPPKEANHKIKITHKSTNKETYLVEMRLVETGEQRNNRIIITSGLKAGEMVVTSGQLKLSSGEEVKINNSVQPY